MPWTDVGIEHSFTVAPPADPGGVIGQRAPPTPAPGQARGPRRPRQRHAGALPGDTAEIIRKGAQQQLPVEAVARLEAGGDGVEPLLEGVVHERQPVPHPGERAQKRPVNSKRAHAVVDIKGVGRAEPVKI